MSSQSRYFLRWGVLKITITLHRKKRYNESTMIRSSAIIAAVIGVAALILTQLGIFDRPAFEYHESLLVGQEVGRELFAIVATSTEKGIGQHVMRLIKGVLEGIESTDTGPSYLKTSAELYGAPEGAERLGIGLYFEDPALVDAPRWAIGWAVATKNFNEAKKLAEETKKASGLDEPIRAVRVGKDNVLKAKIPWHNAFTPWIAPMLHWGRAFDEYSKKGYTSTGREGEDGSIACEIYVSGPKDSYQYIDYVVLMGDTKHTWDDTLPLQVKGDSKSKFIDFE